jgi:hypothetical protein
MRISNGFKHSQKHCDRLLLEFALLAKTLRNYFPFDSITLFRNEYSSRLLVFALKNCRIKLGREELGNLLLICAEVSWLAAINLLFGLRSRIIEFETHQCQKRITCGNLYCAPLHQFPLKGKLKTPTILRLISSHGFDFYPIQICRSEWRIFGVDFGFGVNN